MPESLVQTKIRMVTEGTDTAVKDYAALNAEAEKTAASIAQADAAAQGLNTTINQTPNLPDAGASGAASVKTAVKETNAALEKTAISLTDTGKAGEQLAGVLDSVVPGLGGVFESLTSLNPVAIAGTVAITAMVAVFGELQRQAEETRAAIEAQVKAEADRAFAAVDLQQKLNLAMTGDVAARDRLLQEYAEANEERAKIEARQTDLLRQAGEARAAFAEKEAEAKKLADEGNFNAAYDLFRQADEFKVTAQQAEQALQDYNATVEASRDQVASLAAAVEQLNLTDKEREALVLSFEQGAAGTNTALTGLREGFEAARAKAEETAKGIKEAFETTAASVAKGIQEGMAKAAKAREDAEKRLIDINEKLTAAETDRGAALADRLIEDGRAREMGKLEDKLAAAQAYDAARARNQKLKEAQEQGNAAEVAAQQKFMESQQKLLSTYLKAEQNATEDYSRERVRKLEDLYNTLNDLASQRDVAGFVNARRAGMSDIGRGDEDAGVAARRRREQYDAQAKDLQDGFVKENAIRQQQQAQRLQAIQREGQQELSMASRVQKQIADLRAQYAAQDLRARRSAEDASYKQTVDILQKKRMDELKITAGAAAGVINFIQQIGNAASRLGGGLSKAAARGLPKFDTGTPMITQTGLAVVHAGEGILNPEENARYLRGSSGRQSPNFVIQNVNVGKIASPDDIQQAVNGIVQSIASFGANTN